MLVNVRQPNRDGVAAWKYACQAETCESAQVKSNLSKCANKEYEAWSVYLIRNCLDQLYCGATSNVERRFAEHQAGGVRAARALRGKAPLQLVWHHQLADKSTALRWEYRVKRLSRRQKDALISGSNHLMQQLADTVANQSAADTVTTAASAKSDQTKTK